MKLKIIALLTTILLATTLTTAIDINPEQQELDPIEMPPDESETLEFEITFDGDTEEVFIQDDSTDHTITYSTNLLRTSGTSQLNIHSADQSNTTETVSLTFIEERQDGNETEEIEHQRELELTTIEPVYQIFNDWIHFNQKITIGDEEYEITEIQNNLYLENEEDEEIQITRDEHKTVNNAQLKVEDTIPEEYVRLDVQSEDEDLNFNTSEIEQTREQCTLDLELGGGASSINWGETNIFYTIDEETEDRVPDVEVNIYQRDGGSVVDSFVTDSNGRQQVTLDDQIESDEDIDELLFEFLYLGDDDEWEDCDPNERIIELSTTYEDWLEEEEAMQLDLQLNETLLDEDNNLYGNITGEAMTREGEEVEDTILQIETPEGETNEITADNGELNYQPETTGEHEIRLVKSGYLESDWQTINYQDQCPDQQGTIETEGCLEEEISLTFLNEDGQNIPDIELQAGEEYTIQAQNEDGEHIEDFNEEIEIAGQTVEMQDGEYPFTFDAGEYQVQFAGTDHYENYNSQFQVEGTNYTMILGIAIALIALIGIILLITGNIELENSKSNQMDAAPTTNLDPSGE